MVRQEMLSQAMTLTGLLRLKSKNDDVLYYDIDRNSRGDFRKYEYKRVHGGEGFPVNPGLLKSL